RTDWGPSNRPGQREPTEQQKRFWLLATQPDIGWHTAQIKNSGDDALTFATAFHASRVLAARQYIAGVAFADGPTFAGILYKDSGIASQRLLVGAREALQRDAQSPWNRAVLAGALYRAGDYKQVIVELNGLLDNNELKPWSCHFLALAHHHLGHNDQARAW